MSELIWNCQAFASLSGAQVYEILRLRSEVFVVEQQCIFQDPDGADDTAWHLGAWQAGGLMAYARLLGPGIKAAASQLWARDHRAGGARSGPGP